jgi:uncharacterized protein (DUF305 family)
MTGWLREWGAPGAASAGVPSSGAASAGAASAGAASAGATGTPPRDPVRALIAHQEEAIKLAQAEQSNGTNPAALAFARQVIESRAAQIEQLRTYLS